MWQKIREIKWEYLTYNEDFRSFCMWPTLLNLYATYTVYTMVERFNIIVNWRPDTCNVNMNLEKYVVRMEVAQDKVQQY